MSVIKRIFAASLGAAGSRRGNSPLLWPVLTLLALCLLNLGFNPHFLSVRLLDHHLFGAPIDILNRAVPLILVGLGMTLVIATRGIDISVGAVVAIVAAMAAALLGGSQAFTGGWSPAAAIAAALGIGLVCGLWNGTLVALVGMQPIIATLILMVAGRGVAQLLTAGQVITISNPAYLFVGGGYLLGIPVSLYGRGGAGCHRLAAGRNRTRFIYPGDRDQSGGDAAGRLARQRDCVLGLRLLGLHRGSGRDSDQLQPQKRRRQQCRFAARTRCDSGGDAGRHFLAWRPFQSGRHGAGGVDHPDPDLHHLFDWRTSRSDAGGEGGGGIAGERDPIADGKAMAGRAA